MMDSHDLSIPIQDDAAMDDTLGGRIVHARETAGLTTGELAARLGVTAKTMANWENDRAEPRSNKLNTLAGLLGVSPTWLLAGRGAAPSAKEENGGHELQGEIGRIKVEATRLLRRIDSLSDQIASSERRSSEG
jgi:HTH-type transcriptional regulator, cell division transcriptional repressor